MARDPVARDRSRLLQDDGREGGSGSEAGGGDAGDDTAHNVPHRIPPVAGLHHDLLGRCPRGRDEGRQPYWVEIRRGPFFIFSPSPFSFRFVQMD